MESAEQVLDETENLDEDQENEEDQPDLNAPLELLSSVSARLLRGEIPTNPRRLQSLFEHIQSVVGDVVEASFAKMSSALDEMETAHEALRGEGEDRRCGHWQDRQASLVPEARRSRVSSAGTLS